MQTALQKAFMLIISADAQLINILITTAKTSLLSSLIALIIGVPLGVWLGAADFKGKGILVMINRTLMGLPPVVCGLLFYMLFSGVGPFRHLKLLFTVTIMVMAQVVLITPIVAGNMESFVSGIAGDIKETAKGMGFGKVRIYRLIINESVYQIFNAYLLAFARAIAEVGAVSMVGGAIAWKTNVMTTAIMQYTNMGDFSLGVALGIILMTVSLLVNIVLYVMQRRLSR
ncbi:MAG: ABC transporter permease [Firmicutes bacterium]|nr:ABC transporter permease [Bacillota bacterium]